MVLWTFLSSLELTVSIPVHLGSTHPTQCTTIRISLGRGALMCKWTKQKLNTKSSTKAEVVGSSNYLPNVIWAEMILAEQGYELPDNVFNQDNQSAILRAEVPAHQHSTFLYERRVPVREHLRRVLRHFVPEISRCPFRSLPCEHTHQITAVSIQGAC